jgi:hypothetical protein
MYKVIDNKSNVYTVVDNPGAGYAYIKRLSSLGIDTANLTVKRS